MTRPARHEIAHDLVYDLETGIGWALGSVLVLFARPVAWAVFHDWSQYHRPRLRDGIRTRTHRWSPRPGAAPLPIGDPEVTTV